MVEIAILACSKTAKEVATEKCNSINLVILLWTISLPNMKANGNSTKETDMES
jgi:hypothetical protein